MRNICSVDSCGKFVKGRGLCNNHYTQWFKKIGPRGNYKVFSFATKDPALLKIRFDKKWELNHITGCWLWTSSTSKPFKKYDYKTGEIVVLGKKTKAHRVSWEIYKGAIPEGLHVLHKCDNGMCVNPEHLYIGSHAENMRDMSSRNRSGMAKITPEQVVAIRASNLSAAKLAKVYGIHRSTMQDIKYGRTHKYLAPAEDSATNAA